MRFLAIILGLSVAFGILVYHLIEAGVGSY